MSKYEYVHPGIDKPISITKEDFKQIGTTDPHNIHLKQAMHTKLLVDNISSLLTPSQLTKFCVLFGTKVLADFNTLSEAKAYQKDQVPFMCTHLYIPLQK